MSTEEILSFECARNTLPFNHNQTVKKECYYCQNEVLQKYRKILNNYQKNDCKFVCSSCEERIRVNPSMINLNCMHITDVNFFEYVDSERKAYILGCIAATYRFINGKLCVNFKENLLRISRGIVWSREESNEESFIYISKIVGDICIHLGINTITEDVFFPELENDFLKYSFIRGYFESSGTLYKVDYKPACCISSKSNNIIKSINDFMNISSSIVQRGDMFNIKYSGVNALDFVSKIYDNSSKNLRDESKYGVYINWLNSDIMGSIQLPYCLFSKTDDDAVIPFKHRASDVGYDLVAIKKVKDLSPRTAMYDTCIKVSPAFGYYTKIVPRSSIVKTGYMLSNSIGIIDGNFLGSLKIVLTKIDDSFPNIELPFTLTQLIIEKSIHFKMIEVDEDELGDTQRGEGGFGSTNK